MTVRPSRGMLLAVALAVVLHSLARASGGQWLVVEAGIAVGVVVTSLLLRPRLEALEVRLLSPPRAVVGEVVTQRLIVRNPTRRPVRLAEKATCSDPTTTRRPGSMATPRWTSC